MMTQRVNGSLRWLLGLGVVGFAFSSPMVNAQGAAIEDIHDRQSRGAEVSTSSSSATARPQSSQARSLDERVRRLERTMNSDALVKMLRRLEELQAESEMVRGDIEELNHKLNGIRQRQRDIYLDLDRRIQSLESRPVAAGPPSTSDADSGTGAMGGVSVISSDADRRDYESALTMLRKKQYDNAIGAFEQFLKRHPESVYAANAQYWLGEANYVTRRFKHASKAFETLIAKYPTSSKVADSYLKLGFTQYELGDIDAAKKSLNEVKKQFPNTASARLAEERLQRIARENR